MARRKQFQSIAADLVHFLCSRNFDIDGYWGMAELYLQTYEKDVREMQINLSPQQCDNVVQNPRLQAALTGWILKRMISANMSTAWLKNAYLMFHFDTEEKPAFHQASTLLGHPIIVDVVLISDLGREFTVSKGGYCFRQGKCQFASRRAIGGWNGWRT